MTHCVHLLQNTRPHRAPIRVANGLVVYSELVGEIVLRPLIHGHARSRSVILSNVLYVPALSHNLISTTYLSVHHDYTVLMKENYILFKRNGEVYFVADISEQGQAFVRETVMDKELVTGVRLASARKPDPICEPCLFGKLNAGLFPSTGHRSGAPLDLIHSDLKSYSVPTREGWKHRVTFVDDHTGFKVAYHMKNKSETFAALKMFQAYAETHWGLKIKAFQDDKGGEYMSNEFRSHLDKCGIVHRHLVRARPQQNGTAERSNRTVDEHSTAMLHEANLPPAFRALAVSAYIHVCNMHPTARDPTRTPHELWFKAKPDVSHLRVWGCLAYVHVQRDKRGPSGHHVQKCIFVGYPAGYKGWLFFNPETRKLVIAERAVFDERYFPGSTPQAMRSCPAAPPSSMLVDPPCAPAPVYVPDDDGDDEQQQPPARPLPAPRVPSPAASSDDEIDFLCQAPPPPSPPPAGDAPLHPLPSPPPPQSPIGVAARRAAAGIHRVPAPPRRAPAPAAAPPRRTMAEIFEEIPEDLSDDELLLKSSSALIVAREGDPSDPKLAAAHATAVLIVAREGDPSDPKLAAAHATAVQSVLSAVASGNPRSFFEASKREDGPLWRAAAASEIDSLLSNCTWDVVDLPQGVKPIRSQWVFVIKHKSDGTVERYKARLVADGRGQRYGIDYHEVFAPTFRPATLRVILALAAQNNLKLRSIDFSSAYLNGDLDEDVYMTQPEGFPQGEKGQVLKLNRSIYGLKQAGRQWRIKLVAKLTAMGFKCIKSDSSCHIYSDGVVRVILPIYVDDGTIAAKHDADIDRVIAQLGTAFKVRDLGPTEWLLGIKIERDADTGDISISQRQYAVNLLEQYGMADCKPVDTPMLPGLSLTKEMGAKTEEESKQFKGNYLSAVGSLMYLACQTRPDISYAVGVLARFNSNPGEEHWKAVKHLLRYIQGTLDFRITYSKSSPTLYDPATHIHPDNLFTTFTDADHARDKDSMKSTGGYVIMMAGGPVSWRSKLQSTISLSTTEAEYVAGVDAGKEIKWMRNLLHELEHGVSGASPLMMDNQSAISVSKMLKQEMQRGLESTVRSSGLQEKTRKESTDLESTVRS
ncbi:unnamed protein product [Mycena citricolor]|uniref:Integrase catalytic domain-containing protein n=1 Tax=Mycena citricolor TaxID=2018698 RepID=A0AAD2Q201_9AGAR|nr:unnamed protein product [Mycena citricolor]